MGEQLHRIKRQILELKMPKDQATPAFYAKLRNIYNRSLVPIIEACCSEFADPAQIYRIDRLEVDLGVLNTQDLEAVLVAKLRLELREQLSAHFQKSHDADAKYTQNSQDPSSQSPSAIDSQVEVLHFFARTGALPWWADASKAGLLGDVIETLRQKSPDVLLKLLTSLCRETKALRRIVRYFDDATLSAICRLAKACEATSFEGLRERLFALLKSSRFNSGFTTAALRNRMWEEVLILSYATPGKSVRPELFWRDVLSRMAWHFVCPIAALMDELWQATSRSKTPIDRAVLKIFEPFFSESPPVDHQKTKGLKVKEPEIEDQTGDTLVFANDFSENLASQELAQMLVQLKRAGGFFEPLFVPLRLLLQGLPASLLPQVLSTLESFNLAKTGIPAADQEMNVRLRRFFVKLESEQGVSSVQIKACLWALAENGPQNNNAAFADIDELYIDNAGLVILWPFLSHFFKHMDLMDKKGFKDRASLHRAVLLLQYLVTEEERPPEYHLPLNRILCGMDLATVFEQENPVSEAEAQECEALLEAVIAQVPILKKMSPRGFRGTFLIRKGVLSTRDGAWLLRVTRNEFDVVLDHFPWSMAWVKLPMMSQTLQVEW